MSKHNRIFILILSFLFSAVLFVIGDVDGDVYLVFFAVIWLAVLLAYGSRKNHSLILDLLCFTAGNLAAYCWAYYEAYGIPQIVSLGIQKQILLGVCGAEVLSAVGIVLVAGVWDRAAVWKAVWRRKRVSDGSELSAQPEMFMVREYDLQRLKDYMVQTQIVGLNGPWGSGKSFLVDRLCADKEIRAQYEVIRMDLLSFSLDKLDEVLLSELEKALARHRIFSRHVGKWKKLMGTHEVLAGIQSVFLSDGGSVATMFRDMSMDVRKMRKKILIIFEDIDRISDTDVIKKLFDISEKLAGEKITILYQFDEDELKDKGFDRNYVEKYIPHIVNMTEVPFKDCAKQMLKELKVEDKELTFEELRFLSGPVFDDYAIRRALKMEGEFRIEMHGLPTRKVKTMLQEFQILLKENELLRQKKNKKVLIVFLLMKHIFYDCYHMLNLAERPVNSLVMRYHDKTYTMAQLVYQRKLNLEDEKQGFSVDVLKEIFQDSRNRNVYCVLAFLGYHFELFDAETGEERRAFDAAQDLGERKRSIGLEDVRDIREMNENEKIDRLLWNLLANGKSEFTNMEHLIHKLDGDVLLRPLEEQEEAWDVFGHDYFYEENLWKDNENIFPMGVSYFLKIFQAFRVAEASQEQWLRLLEFYFSKRSGVDMSRVGYLMIEVLNYCDLRKQKVYLWIIRKLPTIPIAGNLNQEKCYLKFLQEYLKAAEYWGYGKHYESWKLDFSGSICENEALTIHVLQEMIESMKHMNDMCRIEMIKRERQDMIHFLEWNLELIGSENALKYPVGGFKTSTSTRMHHEYPQVYERLDKMKEAPEYEDAEFQTKFIAEIEKEYAAGRLNVYEAEQLLSKPIQANIKKM